MSNDLFMTLFQIFWGCVFTLLYLIWSLIVWAWPIIALAAVLYFIGTMFDIFASARDARMREIIRDELSRKP